MVFTENSKLFNHLASILEKKKDLKKQGQALEKEEEGKMRNSHLHM